jgi:hypothetical protein
MTGAWTRRIAEAGVAVSMIMLLGGLSQEGEPGRIVSMIAAGGLLTFGFLLVVAGRSGS